MSTPIVIQVTYVELLVLVNTAALQEGIQYNITDRDIRLTAISSAQFNPDGLRLMLCPSNYGILTDAYGNIWKGVWHSGQTPTAGDLVVWGGLVWRNLTGSVGTNIDDFGLDLINWVVIPKATFTNHEYTQMSFSVNYDYVNDWVNRQWDKDGNIFGMNYADYQASSYAGDSNRIDICDWNIATGCYSFRNNNCLFLYNNFAADYIINNNITGEIKNNVILYAGINHNRNIGDIGDNTVDAGITNNCNNGNISSNIMASSIYRNNNNGAIFQNTGINAIMDNSNNGYISNNHSHSSIDIKNNQNNGNITGNWSSNVTDTVVTKTGTDF